MDKSPKRNFWDVVQYSDPRILYGLFALAVVFFEFYQPKLPIPVADHVRFLYDRIENLRSDKIVVIDCDLASGIRAECQGQYEAVVRHLFSRGIKFAVLTWTQNPEGQKYGRDLADKIAREMGKEYGTDYCVWKAITQAGGATLQALAKDIEGFVKSDIDNTPLRDIPMMKSVRDISDVALIYRVSYMWDGVPWIGFVQAVYGTPLAMGAVGITSSTAYPFLDSGQLCGMLAGAAGAAAYEQLVNAPGMGTKTVSVQSFATLYVLIAITLGNVAMFAARWSARRRK